MTLTTLDQVTDSQIKAFHKKILDWYKENKRDLPWRYTKDPYYIAVSEIMLQQTQVDRVINYYLTWIERFPTVQELSEASTQDVLTLWSGLGYNNRALRLQKLAQVILNEHHGVFPKTYEALLELPGIGPYTAGAIMAFSYNKDVAVVDTNIRRVFIDSFGLDESLMEKDMTDFALRVCPKRKSRIWYNALMDYGATVRTARKTGIKATSQQSEFKGSNREVRGYITKHIIKNGSVHTKDIMHMFPKKNVETILKGMLKDGLIQIKNNEVTFA